MFEKSLGQRMKEDKLHASIKKDVQDLLLQYEDRQNTEVVRNEITSGIINIYYKYFGNE